MTQQQTIGKMPYYPLEFSKDAATVHPEQVAAVLAAAGAGEPPAQATIRNLFVVSHGWNNDMAEAQALYDELFANVSASLEAHGQNPALWGVAGVLWPSKRWADKDLVPGGAASVSGGDQQATIERQIAVLEEITGADLSHTKALVPKIDHDEAAAREFATAILAHFPKSADEEGDHRVDPGLAMAQVRSNATRFLTLLGTPTVAAPAGGGGAASMGGAHVTQAAGGAAGLGDWFAGVKGGALNLLNYITYYKMKERAGIVGREAVNPVLRRIKARGSASLHLVGHSFGGRVVTSAAAGRDDAGAVPVQSLSLLQAAFSHYAFAQNYDGKQHDGFFRRVLRQGAPGRVGGAAIVTHSKNDTAVGIAYAIASRARQQIASAVGDASDPYGGLGRNGALKTPEAPSPANFRTLLTDRSSYGFKAGGVYNLNGDATITGHSDIRRPEVAHAVVEAALTPPAAPLTA